MRTLLVSPNKVLTVYNEDAMTKTLSGSLEDYLEMIENLHEKNSVVRVKDISEAMNVSKPSVVGALRELKQRACVLHEAYGHVELTAKGKRYARHIQERHALLVLFLTQVLRVDRRISEEDACKMEHAISNATAKKLTAFMTFINEHERGAELVALFQKNTQKKRGS